MRANLAASMEFGFTKKRGIFLCARKKKPPPGGGGMEFYGSPAPTGGVGLFLMTVRLTAELPTLESAPGSAV